MNSLLDTAGRLEAGEEGGLTHAQRIALRGDLDRIRGWFEQEFVRDGARGMAVFCGSLDGIWRTRPLLAPVADGVHLDRRLALAPLTAHVGVGDGALVVVAGREQGRFLRLRDGKLEPVADLYEDQPGRHDQGGWSQARFQRRIDELASDHLRDVALELDRRVRDAGGALDVVIVAPEESRAELAGHLSQPVQHALAGWGGRRGARRRAGAARRRGAGAPRRGAVREEDSSTGGAMRSRTDAAHAGWRRPSRASPTAGPRRFCSASGRSTSVACPCAPVARSGTFVEETRP